MKKYFTFFKIRFQSILQYRTAGWAGVATQFVWGGMRILMFMAFYEADRSRFPMEFTELSSYIWLQQGLLSNRQVQHSKQQKQSSMHRMPYLVR